MSFDYISIIDICKEIKRQEGFDGCDYTENGLQREIVNQFSKYKSSKQCYLKLTFLDKNTLMLSKLDPGYNCDLIDLYSYFTLEQIGNILIKTKSNLGAPQYCKNLENIIIQMRTIENILRDDRKHLRKSIFSYSIGKLLSNCCEDFCFKTVREVASSMKFTDFVKNNLSRRCNANFAKKFYTAICKEPNFSQLVEIYEKFPPICVFSISTIPSDYPPAAIGMCTVCTRKLYGKLDVSVHTHNFFWAPKSFKTKYKRSDEAKPARIQFYRQAKKKRRNQCAYSKSIEIFNDYEFAKKINQINRTY